MVNTLLQQTLISGALHTSGENGSISTSKEGTSQRYGPWLIKEILIHLIANFDRTVFIYSNKTLHPAQEIQFLEFVGGSNSAQANTIINFGLINLVQFLEFMDGVNLMHAYSN